MPSWCSVLGLVTLIRPRFQSMSPQRSSNVSDGVRRPPNRARAKISRHSRSGHSARTFSATSPTDSQPHPQHLTIVPARGGTQFQLLASPAFNVAASWRQPKIISRECSDKIVLTEPRLHDVPSLRTTDEASSKLHNTRRSLAVAKPIETSGGHLVITFSESF